MVDQLTPRLEVQPRPDTLAEVAAAFIAERLERADRDRGRSTIALSGGATPAPVYARLALRLREADWGRRVEFYWGDERFVPADSAISNYLLAAGTLLTPAAVPPQRVHRILTEGAPSAEAAAAGYEATLRASFGDADTTLDVALQGIGPDGHTASLFPGESAVDETQRWCVGVPDAPQPPHVPRVTLTVLALNRSRTVVLLATGSEKASIVQQALAPACDGVPLLPAARLHGVEETAWFLDAAAAQRLDR